MATVELRGVAKVFPGGVEALARTDLAIDDGEFFVIVGPSGSGKTTLLRLIAGLETPSAGSLWIGGQRADGLPPRDRDIAMVFQNPALYPHLTVFDNLAFGLRARGRRPAEVRERVHEVSAQLGVATLLKRSPRTLSGGERQRVALGRALARRPRLLLLDEPFSSLDAPLREALRAELLALHRRLATTMIQVTHDQAEALALGTRIAVMNRGQIVQTGPPLDVYDRPASRFVAEFVGSPPMSIQPCEIVPEEHGFRVLPLGAGTATDWILSNDAGWCRPGRVDLGLRPEQVEVAAQEERTPGFWEIGMEIARWEPRGHETIAGLTCGSFALNARLPSHCRFQVGDRVFARFDPSRACWFDPETGSRIAGAGPSG